MPCIYNKIIYDSNAFDATLYVSSISMLLMVLHVFLLLMFPVTFVRTKYSMGLSCSLIFFHAPEFISLIAGIQRVICDDATQRATAQSNWLCALQGCVLIYGVISTHSWGAMRICTLYSALTFKVVLTGKAVTLAMSFICSVLPLIPVALALALKAITFEGGQGCVPSPDMRGFLSLWGLLCLVVVPIITLHILTFHKIAKTFRSRKARQGTIGAPVFSGRGQDPAQDEKGRLARLASNRPVENSVLAFWLLEWRPFLSMALVATMTPLFILHSISIWYHHDEYTAKTVLWIGCLNRTDGSISECAPLVRFWKNNLQFLSAAMLYHCYVGIIVFVVEVSKALIPGCSRWLMRKRQRSGSGSESPMVRT